MNKVTKNAATNASAGGLIGAVMFVQPILDGLPGWVSSVVLGAIMVGATLLGASGRISKSAHDSVVEAALRVDPADCWGGFVAESDSDG